MGPVCSETRCASGFKKEAIFTPTLQHTSQIWEDTKLVGQRKVEFIHLQYPDQGP